MDWLDRLKTIGLRLKTIGLDLAEKANLITPEDKDAPDEVSSFAPYQGRRWIPLAVMGGVVLIAIWFLAAGGESEKDVTHILEAKPAEPGPPRDIRAKMPKKKKEAEKVKKTNLPEADEPEAKRDDFFFGKDDKKEKEEEERELSEKDKKAELDKGYDDLVSAMKAAADKKDKKKEK